MTNLISQKNNNYRYAPGISLYGVDGKDGKSGLSGTSVFVSQIRIDTDTDLREFARCIRQGRSTFPGSAEYIGRAYMDGDAFLFPNGYIYRLTDIKGLIEAGDNVSTENFTKYLELVGRVTVSNEDSGFVDSYDRLVLDTNNYKGFVINVSELPDSSIGSIESPMSIISDKITSDEMIRFIDMKSIQSGESDVRLRIQYDTNNRCFMLASDNPILVDGDLEVAYSDSVSRMTYDEFSKVQTAQSGSATLTTFKTLCGNVGYEILGTDTEYAFQPDEDVTEQIYYYNTAFDSSDSETEWGPADLKRIVPDTTVPQDDSRYRLWKYAMHYGTFGNGRKHKRVKITACYNSIEGADTEWEFIVRFTREDTMIVGSDMRIWYMSGSAVMKDVKNGKYADEDYDGMAGTGAKYLPGVNGGMMFVTKFIYVPSEASELWISAPGSMFVMVSGNLGETSPVSASHETEKIRLLVNGDWNWSSSGNGPVRFPIDVLMYATRRFVTKFKLFNNNTQSVYLLDKNNMLHFTGLLESVSEEGYDATEVDREYYHALPHDEDDPENNLILPGGSAVISVESLYDPTGLKWIVSLIGDTEFIIREQQ